MTDEQFEAADSGDPGEMGSSITLIGRVATQTKLPTSGLQQGDVYAVTRGRKFAGWDYRGRWVVGNWDDPGMARDYFEISLEDVPEVAQ